MRAISIFTFASRKKKKDCVLQDKQETNSCTVALTFSHASNDANRPRLATNRYLLRHRPCVLMEDFCTHRRRNGLGWLVRLLFAKNPVEELLGSHVKQLSK
ncbi:hypothetical protein CEXT_659321 [Caerostris extrusa]|uniref:Uncharacterized protein n=1 Tax=Caerostris extrusa TaxID=172846 RepID=A0AAV4XM07_CAEEX|nr:hypothetical protein CEXT_659321 [Caerostris extrusa]